jgi:AhpC/TSA family/Disulphide bond corrector protein DsbC
VELEARVEDLKKWKLGLVAISYDSVETLKRFADARRITFPLVSDPGSAIIKRYGLLNTTVEPGTRAYGVPFPGTFIVDRQGVVRSRFFEDAYQERNTVASILVRQGGTAFGLASIVDTPHLRLKASVSDARVAPGERVSLVFDIEPKPRMHVYAPGKHTYQVVRASIETEPWLRVQAMAYPPSEIYHFKPLNERVEVYQKPFRLVQDVTVLATRDAQEQLATLSHITIAGRLEYQACDEKLCYMPQSIPVRWTLAVAPLERK